MLRTVDLDLGIGTRRLVSGLQWTVSPGECWCVIGPNGVGKSTLLRALAGLRTPDRGHVALDGRTLSGGERQRVAIASVLAQQTPLLILDEPANALDLAHQVGVMRLLAGLCRDAHKAVVLVSHDLNLAQRIASHALLLMGDGQWQAGPAADVMNAPLLGRCLGHPIDAVRHGDRIIYIPAEEKYHE